MTDNDESRKAFEADFYYAMDVNEIHAMWSAWQAAVEWARNDERERLANLAESQEEMSVLWPHEIRAGKIED